MSIGYLKKTNSKARKGISPVVATVILVAVAVVIAAALAGFAGSLFGSYSQGPQIKVLGMTMDTSGVGTLTLANAGNNADAIKSISINNFAPALTAATDFVGQTTTDNTLPANTNAEVYDFTMAPGGTPIAGTQVTATIVMQSGSSITQTLTLS